jgi:ATP-binding cassette subfamily B protein
MKSNVLQDNLDCREQDPLDAEEAELDTENEDEADEAEEVHVRDLCRMTRFLRPFARPHARPLLLLGLVLLAETVINFSFPLATQYLVDEGLIQHDFGAVLTVLIFLAAAAVSVALLGVACDYLNARIFSTMVSDIRQRLFGHMQGLSMPFFTRTQAGGVLSRFSGDVVTVENTLLTVVPWCIVPLLEVIYSVVLMFLFNFWLGLIGSVVFPLILLGPRFFAARAFALSYDKRKSEADVLCAVQENVSAQPVVKAFGLQPLAQTRFRSLNTSWLSIAFRTHFLGALVERSSNTGVYLVHLLIFGLGAYWAFIGEISVGTLVAFEATFLSMGYALTYVTQYTPTLAQAAGSIHHLDELLDQRPQVTDSPNAVPLARPQSAIVFENVSFSYPDGSFEVSGVDVRIPRRSFVAFVGTSGSGKSTLLNLLLRFHDPSKGAILIDGHDLRTVTQQSLHSHIGMVFQDSFLFNASILDNIRMGNPQATLKQVKAAARAAEIHDFIASLPRGYHTVVGERGSQLSGGQRQRLAIARALVRDPAILVLDEATSALDYATESALNATLKKIARRRTVITVTHRLGSVVGADNIVVLDQGTVVEQGTHKELLALEGTYAELWCNQRERKVGIPAA